MMKEYHPMNYSQMSREDLQAELKKLQAEYESAKNCKQKT